MSITDNRPLKINFFGVKEFSFIDLASKMSVSRNLRITTKNHTADPEIGFITKSISKPYDRGTAVPTAWGLIFEISGLIFLRFG